MFRSGIPNAFLTLLVGALLMLECRHDPLAAWDNDFADFLARNSHRSSQPAPVTLVGIDDACLASHPWPWTPLDFSLFFQAALPYRPEVVAIEEVLDWDRFVVEPEQQGKLPQYEKILRDAILRAPKVLLGAHLGFPEDPTVIPPLQEVPQVRNVRGDVTGVPEFTVIERQPKEAYRLSSTVGFGNLPAVRARHSSVPLVLRYRGQVIPSFVLQSVMLWKQLTPEAITVELGSHVAVGPQLRIPIDTAGRMRVDFGSPRGGFSFDDLLLAAEQAEAGRPTNVPLENLNGSIVILARTDAGARTLPLAAARKGSPGELFAAAIATIQNQSFIRRAPLWAEALAVAAIAAIAFRLLRIKKTTTLGAGVVTIAAYVLVAMAVFSRWLIWLPILPVLGAMLVAMLYRIVIPDSVQKPKRPVIF